MKTDQPERLRLFVALSVPAEVKERIVATQHALKKVAGQGVRWTSPEQFHLTLRFLGSVDTEKVEGLISALQNACGRFGPLKLRASQIGFFPRPRSPRVIWVGVTDEEERLRLLYSQIQSATNPFTNEGPEDRFKGHVTLGRVKEIGRNEADRLEHMATDLSETLFGSWTTRQIELIRSQLSPRGAVYSLVASVPLD